MSKNRDAVQDDQTQWEGYFDSLAEGWTAERDYLNLMRKVRFDGLYVGDRTNTGCYSLFGATLRFDLSKGFPLLTTKTINFNNIVGELLFFLSGKNDLPTLRHYSDKPLGAHTIWSDDYKKFKEVGDWNVSSGEHLGAVYPEQWRVYSAVDCCGEALYHDQIQQLLTDLKSVVAGDMTKARRLIVSSWNPYDHTVGDKVWCALPACHTEFQVVVREGKLNLRFTMRSTDVFLGLSYNIASYALLCHILAKLVGLEVGEVFYVGTDVHLYSNHIGAADTQLSRTPTKFPELVLPEFDSLEELLKLTAMDFKLEGYNPQGFIKAPQAS